MLTNLKNKLRESMAIELAKLSVQETDAQSEKIFERVVEADWYQKSQRISVYVSTKGEIQTDKIIKHALNLGKDVFIPQFQKGSNDMEMVKVPSEEEFDQLPATLWGIRQPKISWRWEKYQDSGAFDLVLMPGVAFSADLCRLGHGKGYYDRFLQNHHEIFNKYPIRVGLSLSQQIIGSVPCNGSDVPLDYLLVPDDL